MVGRVGLVGLVGRVGLVRVVGLVGPRGFFGCVGPGRAPQVVPYGHAGWENKE